MTVQEGSTLSERGSDFAKLKRRVVTAGLLERRPLYYTVKITTTLLLFAAGWVAFFIIGASWLNLITAAYLAVMTTQLAFIGHDTGHQQVFPPQRSGLQLGLGLFLGNLLAGISFGWWNNKHNRHHGNPNHIDLDPDVHVGALVFTKHQAEDRGMFGRFLSRHQAKLFFGMLFLEGLNLHWASIRALLDGTIKSKRMIALESGLFLVHAVAYLTAVFTVLSPLQAIAFMALHQGLWGVYMGLSFAPNHKGMPILEPGHKLDYLRKQVLTSRNIRRGLATDWLLGGLNYQIEHHLFPSMPRPSLARSQEIIREYCESIGVEYTETSAWESYRTVLQHLDDVGADA